MKTYIFTALCSSPKRGCNRTVTVYRVKNNQPTRVGYDDEINTYSYKGDRAVACQIINAKDNLKMSNCGYFLEDSNIKVIAI